MPSGKTHDSISWYFFLPFAYLAWYLTSNWVIVAIFSLAYLFSSFMFGGDLDLNSIQTKRWGIFRWIWIPYQKVIPHRSPLSHGIFLGTVFRILYLGFFIMAFYIIIFLLTHNFHPEINKTIVSSTESSLLFVKNQPSTHFLAVFAGLTAGAGLHTASDVVVSKVKRMLRKGKKKKTRKK